MIKEKESNLLTDMIEYSPTTKHLFPKEAQHFFEVIGKNMPTNTKYFKAQKNHIINKVNNIYKENPSQSVRTVIIQCLSTLPDFLTGENLIKVVTYITETWTKCEATQLQEITQKNI